MSDQEILNIDYHTRRLIVKALNLYPTKVFAAVKLGVSERNLHRLIARYLIDYDDRSGKYYYHKSKRLAAYDYGNRSN